MDRRKRKTREAIFTAFVELLSKKDFSQITVGEIIEKADVGRATFYSHFETKDFLMKEFCEELFCHIFDAAQQKETDHRHIFDCQAPNSVFLHLLQHLQKNENHILELLSCRNNELFLQYFKAIWRNWWSVSCLCLHPERTKGCPIVSGQTILLPFLWKRSDGGQTTA